MGEAASDGAGSEAGEELSGWPVDHATGSWMSLGDSGPRWTGGDAERVYKWASVTKLATSLAVLVAVEEGTLALDEVVLGEDVTVAHLLSHAGGLAPDGAPSRLAVPGARRIYSNSGYELLGEALGTRAGMAFGEYLAEAVLAPLGLERTTFKGSPAGGLRGPIVDLMAFAAELMRPTLISEETSSLSKTVAFPGIDGVLPGFGQQRPCDWGLGPEIRGHKDPHWMPAECDPSSYGHFGRSGSFLFVDPVRGLACGALADRDFGGWAAQAWPRFGSAVLRDWQRVSSPG
ncbi:MAG TPA: serine hydrolase domain-containing protein [Acidimicrobiales bacterium]|nr:serine hydrolase domain-containing protein [Acidimicrobiales bacterium]